METKTCMNTSCGATVTSTWKTGWLLKSGQTAVLCFNCGTAYEKLTYCDAFHAEETGWRECSLCNKRLHCGCSASMPFIEIQDFGGVWCNSCAHRTDRNPTQRDGLPSEAPPKNTNTLVELLQNPQPNSEPDHHSLNDRSLLSLGMPVDSVFFGLQMGIKNPVEFASKGLTNLSQPSPGTPNFAKTSDDRPNSAVRNILEPQLLSSLNFGLGTSSDSTRFSLPPPARVEEGDKNRLPVILPMQRPRHILPKLTKTNSSKSFIANKDLDTPRRVARPPSEARLRSQLLPRYWPRVTDEELQKLSVDLNSTVVPLFEKVLSASDASRIGRLVLPKACAEAYFPAINQSEGLPVKVLDVNGNEWTFQFRFWPNNNSRMYVLEGVTPCIQSMQLEAGDTVIFSRIDAGGKLVIGARKAETQDQQTPHNGVLPEDNFHPDISENRPTVNGSTGLQSMRGCNDDGLNYVFEQTKSPNGDTKLSKSEQFKGKTNAGFLQRATVSLDKKKARNIGSKSKRLLMHSEDALVLRMTWDEAQDLLRPPAGVQPTVVVVEDFEFEEFEGPPVFGKKTMFTAEPSGGNNQWAQCDKCAKWRKLPYNVLLPSTWSCLDNVWDLSRSSCSALEVVGPKEWTQILKASRGSKRRKVIERDNQVKACEPAEPSGLDFLANAAVLGEHASDSPEPSGGATTRHPRHRPGCSCIVCIQPPSGKGKHKSNCSCNVCLTVKRRFKTLMLRKKKKRQDDRDVEMALQANPLPEDPEPNAQAPLLMLEGPDPGAIDLNFRPTREEEMRPEPMAEPGSKPNDEPVRGPGSGEEGSGAGADHGGRNSMGGGGGDH